MVRPGPFIALHTAKIRIATVLLAVAAIGVAVWFQPHKLFIDKTVDESIPGAALAAEQDPAPDDERSKGRAATGGSTHSEDPVTLRRGTFRGLEHETKGQATVLELNDDSRFLRLEGFTTSNGPDLRVYLSEVPAGDDWYAYGERFVDLGPLKGNVGDQNYMLPDDVDLTRFKSAVIWCRRFAVGFGVAALESNR